MSDDDIDAVMGIAWYDEDDWERLNEVCVDDDELEDTWEEWHDNASQRYDHVDSAGFDVRKIHLDPDEFEEWCSENSRPPDGKARAAYTDEKIREQDEG